MFVGRDEILDGGFGEEEAGWRGEVTRYFAGREMAGKYQSPKWGESVRRLGKEPRAITCLACGCLFCYGRRAGGGQSIDLVTAAFCLLPGLLVWRSGSDEGGEAQLKSGPEARRLSRPGEQKNGRAARTMWISPETRLEAGWFLGQEVGYFIPWGEVTARFFGSASILSEWPQCPVLVRSWGGMWPGARGNTDTQSGGSLGKRGNR